MYIKTAEHKQNISKAMMGRVLSDETKEKMSITKRGKLPSNLGISFGISAPVQRILRVCKTCNKEFITNNLSQKHCGSSREKGTCSYKNRMKSYPQGYKDKECLMCNNTFKPQGRNQKYCGGKYEIFTCSWKNQMKKYNHTWLHGFTVKI